MSAACRQKMVYRPLSWKAVTGDLPLDIKLQSPPRRLFGTLRTYFGNTRGCRIAPTDLQIERCWTRIVMVENING
jgi:hypothetical protein